MWPFRRPAAPASPELGTLGTHAFVVTDWEPGPTTVRPVNMGDTDSEPLRRTQGTHGPLAFAGDQTLPLFQGERVPSIAESPEVTDASTYLEAYVKSLAQAGYPS